MAALPGKVARARAHGVGMTLERAVEPVLEVQNLEVVYRGRRPWPWKTVGRLTAVSDLSFRIDPGETFALVGESGSGKSTVARAVQGLVPARGGRILFEGRDVTMPIGRRDPLIKQRMQIVFQNPDASLNPRHSVATILGRPLSVFHHLAGAARLRRAGELLADTNLDAGYLRRMPRQLSGGERQRIAIARALAAEPVLLLCDEILSALDVSVQASVIDLLGELQRRRGLTYLFISHDLSVVRWLAHRVGVLFAGSLCEVGPVEEVFRPPYHPYTESLLAAVPRPAHRRDLLPAREGEAALSAAAPPEGCPYALRCPRRIEGLCERTAPPVQALAPGHEIRCHVPAGELARSQRDLAA
jgi:peptide/nickel transport system ATP-binding protein